MYEQDAQLHDYRKQAAEAEFSQFELTQARGRASDLDAQVGGLLETQADLGATVAGLQAAV